MVAIIALGLIACVRETFSLFWGMVSLMIYPGPKKKILKRRYVVDIRLAASLGTPCSLTRMCSLTDI
jgi:hypothetical protein